MAEDTIQMHGRIGMTDEYEASSFAPAQAFGNCVVLMPAGLTAGCAHVIADLLTRHRDFATRTA